MLFLEIIQTSVATATFCGTIFVILFATVRCICYDLSLEAQNLDNRVNTLLYLQNKLQKQLDDKVEGLLSDKTIIVDNLPLSWSRSVKRVGEQRNAIKCKMEMTRSSWNFFPRVWLAWRVKGCSCAAKELMETSDFINDERLVSGLVILKEGEKIFRSLTDMESKLTTLRGSMSEAKDQKLTYDLPPDWFEKTDSAIEEVRETRNRYIMSNKNDCQQRPDPCLNCDHCNKLYEVVKDMLKVFQDTECFLKNEKVADVKHRPIRNYVLAHERELQRAMQLIQEGCSVVIWGMRGIGKTTLLSRINNHFYGKHVTIAGFDIVIFVTAGRGACIQKVQADIGMRLGIKLSETGIINEQANEIWNSLKSKNFLLLVDDIWEGIEPTSLFKSVENDDSEKRNVVVMTARDERILSRKQIKGVEVNFLSEDLSCELFRNHLDGESLLQENEVMEKYVAKIYGGLPSALVAAGKFMSYQRQKYEWRDATRKLVDPTVIYQASKDMEELFISLKFSLECYPHDRDDMLKILFFCLDHEDGISITNLLQRLLMESMQDASNFKDEHLVHIKNLRYNGLLMYSEDVDKLEHLRGSVRLHNCVRYMLAWLLDSGEDSYLELVRYNYNGLKASKELPHLERWENAVGINMRRFPEEKISEGVEIPDCKKLSSFLAKESCFICLPRGFFDCMKLLRLLDLSYLRKLEELPGSIRSLINLRWLDLSWCHNLKKLPKEMQHLKQLVYLFLQETPKLKDIPRECFSELHKLHGLYLRNCAFEWTWDSDKQQASLHDIRKLMKDGLLRKAEFDLKVDEEGILKFWVHSPRLLRCIRKLTVDFRNFKEVKKEISLLIKNMLKMESLVDLTLKCIREDSLLDFDVPPGSSPREDLPLQCLTIEDWPGLNYIAMDSWKFPNLKSVTIKNCPEFKHVPFNRQNTPKLTVIFLNGQNILSEFLIGKEEVRDWKEMMMKIVGEKSKFVMQEEDVPNWLLFLREKERDIKFIKKKMETLKSWEEKRRRKGAKEWLERVVSFIDCTSRVFFANKDIDHVPGREICLPHKNKVDFVREKGKQLIQFYQEVAAHHKRLMEEGRMQLESRKLESRNEILPIEPFEIRFPFELREKSSCSLQLSNNSWDTNIRFHVQPPTTIRNQYCIPQDSRPMKPLSTMKVEVTLEALMKVPIDLLQCNDKIIVKSSIVDKDDQPSAMTEEEKHIYMLPVTYDATCLNICDSYYGIVLDQLLKYHLVLNEGVDDFTELHFSFGVVDCWAFMKVLLENDPQLKMLRKVQTLRLDFRKLGEGKEDIKLLAQIVVNMESLSEMELEYIEDQHFRLLFQGSFLRKLHHVTISNACGDIDSATWKLFPPCLKRLKVQECENLTTLLLSTEINPIRDLTIENCPKLKSIAIQSCQFPLLEDVSISRCPELKEVPFTPQNAPMLQRYG